ncbi:hypothetical protein AVEN_46427-1 [Araneus ventricosus]|uniref:Retrovirus-related Pol polyprotein from transposon TNT 1-94-like beta-barrel domain-containing protein n=1 Tax=Araneus ventricosus TaxID=182803 RepID=A0A4Y2QJA9_ARAVE|nr:hypothetical protein AVEN_46427-1 [Araneus ventricosus]
MLLMERGLFKFIGKSEPVLAESATSREKIEFENQKCKALATIYLNLEETHSQQAAKALKNAVKSIPEDEVAYQVIENLSPEFENIVQQIYQLNGDEFLPDKVKKILLDEEEEFYPTSECRLKSTKNHSLKDKTPLAYSSKMSAIYASTLYADSDETEWTIDTVATDHFYNKKELFQDYKDLKNKSAALGEGNTVISGIGNVVLEILRKTVSRLC